MKIKTIESQHRRDFYAIYQCEHCGHEHRGPGYDDTHFHTVVVPGMSCTECGKKADDTFRALAPKYPAHLNV